MPTQFEKRLIGAIDVIIMKFGYGQRKKKKKKKKKSDRRKPRD